LGRGIIWRVEENEVVDRAPGPLEEGERVAPHHPADRAERLEVRAHRGNGALVVVHERGGRGAAREGLDPERGRRRVEVEHPGAAHVAEDVDECFADAVGGRSGGPARGRLQRSAAVLPRHDPHTTGTRMTLCGY